MISNWNDCAISHVTGSTIDNSPTNGEICCEKWTSGSNYYGSSGDVAILINFSGSHLTTSNGSGYSVITGSSSDSVLFAGRWSSSSLTGEK